MNHNKIIHLVILLTILAPGCRRDSFPPPLDFNGFEGNPVLVHGEPGNWDDLYVITANVVEDKDTIYLFYLGYSQAGSRALGVATSTDRYHFVKDEGNPILEGDGEGYDAFGVGQAQILKIDSGWVWYFNGREIAGFSCGAAIGRATAASLKGPWSKSREPVLVTGKRGEWDSDFIYLGPVMIKEDGSYVMYYSAGEHLFPEGNYYIGMATSKDGINWKKYNDPATTDHPFADSDPVMKTGKPGAWDAGVALVCAVLKIDEGYGMLYSCDGFGYATSKDGIHWERYPGNPVFTYKDDPYAASLPWESVTIQGAKLLFRDSTCLMYYDYGHGEGNAISVAIATAK